MRPRLGALSWTGEALVKHLAQSTLALLGLALTLAAGLPAGASIGPAAGDALLADIRVQAEQARAEAPQHIETRGASPRLATIKHALRDWVESRLSQLPSEPDGGDAAAEALATRLNAELEQAQILSTAQGDSAGDGLSALGSLVPLRLEYRLRHSYLLLRTGVAVQCGADESAYLYRWREGHWERAWQSEQSDYSPSGYAVQWIRAIVLAPQLGDTPPRVLTLGTSPWCSSNWQAVYVRLWTLSTAGNEPRLLLDKAETGYLGASDEPVQGTIGHDDVLAEYEVGSLDGGVHSRRRVLHYACRSDGVERIDPVALGPRDFVEEWLAQPWAESSRWSLASARDALEKTHRETGRDEFIGPTRRCRMPDLWQVGLGATRGKQAPIYFLVRWRPPYRFTMIAASHKPAPTCAEEDPGADEERALFPTRDWRR